jgi:hypothetical protein
VGGIGFKTPLKMDKEQCASDLIRWARDILNG